MIDRITKHAKEAVKSKDYGRLHKLACQRHLNDLKKSKEKTYPFRFDVEKANALLEFAETLTINEGYEQQQVKLKDFQSFILGCRRGWVYKDTYYEKNKKIKPARAGKRRFRRSYVSMARQNGKTFLNGIEGTNTCAFSGYKYGKLATVATKQKQARLAWEEMEKFIEADDDLLEYFDIKDYASLIECKTNGCTIEAISKERSLDEGFRYIYASVDELHQHKDNKTYNAVYNGTKNLPETLVSVITTRGDKLNSFCYDFDNYCVKVLEGIATADDLFVDIYCLDDEDELFDKKNLIKANPYLATTESGLEGLIDDMKTAEEMGDRQKRDYITKSLNMWHSGGEDRFIDPEEYVNCESERTLEEIAKENKNCYVGLDLSSGGDLTSLSLLFEAEDDKEYYYSHSFMPKGRMQEHIKTDTAPYDMWQEKELISITGGSMDFKNDYSFIISHLKEIKERYGLNYKCIGYDPHNADGILAELEELGCPLLMVTQSAKYLNDATEAIQLQIKSQKCEFDKNNELLSWSFSNAKLVKNSFGEMKIDKEPRALTKRIDPVDACIDAKVAKMKSKEIEEVNVDDALDEYLNMMNF